MLGSRRVCPGTDMATIEPQFLCHAFWPENYIVIVASKPMNPYPQLPQLWTSWVSVGPSWRSRRRWSWGRWAHLRSREVWSGIERKKRQEIFIYPVLTEVAAVVKKQVPKLCRVAKHVIEQVAVLLSGRSNSWKLERWTLIPGDHYLDDTVDPTTKQGMKVVLKPAIGTPQAIVVLIIAFSDQINHVVFPVDWADHHVSV